MGCASALRPADLRSTAMGAPELACELASPGGPADCRWCGAPLPPRRHAWCSDACANAYNKNHWWPDARRAARRRDKYRCRLCQRRRADGIRLEVNHLVQALGAHARVSCAHHLANLETLCNECHASVTRAQRAAAAG